ncbi:MAG: hypothetical protein EPO24_02935 [Bacteroidetes bacterium]|nr:MAG: hypothetical protein EPO24_02935 [Bacteroidota bacterium]
MGKYSLLLAFSVSFTLLILGRNQNRSAVEAYRNFLTYHAKTTAHNIAVSGATMSSNALFLNSAWNNGFYKRTLSGGEFTSTIVDVPGTPRKKITSVSSYFAPDSTYSDTVIVLLQPSGFGKYAYYSVVEGAINWTKVDTVWGPFHTQDKMTVNIRPVFFGKVTNNKGLYKNPSSSQPQFLGGYQTGVNIPLPTSSLNTIRAAAQAGGKYLFNMDLLLTFNADSTVTYKEGGGPTLTMLLSNYAPNGVICVDRGEIRTKGTCAGRVTICAMGTSPDGRIWLDDDIKYRFDPRDLPGAKNILGIVAENEIFIDENAQNNNDIIVQAAIFSLKKGFGAEHYDSRPVSGTIFLLGGITQYQRQAVGTINTSTGKVLSGFAKNYKYDTRLMTDAPPYFPTTGTFEIVAWRE